MTQKITITIASDRVGNDLYWRPLPVSAEIATAGYGIHFNAHGDYSFDNIKGILDLFSGLLICSFALTKQTKALGTTLAVGTIIPIMDLLIVLNKDYNGITQAMPREIAFNI